MDYVNDRGENEIRLWLNSQSLKTQTKIDVRLLEMTAMPHWPPQYISAYRGVEHIFELKITRQNVQYRPLGCYGPSPKEFTLLIGAIEKGGKIPKGTLMSAEDRRKIVLNNRSRVCEHQYDQNSTD